VENKWIQKEEDVEENNTHIKKKTILDEARELLSQITIPKTINVIKASNTQIKPNTRMSKRLAEKKARTDRLLNKKNAIYANTKERYKRALSWFDLDETKPPVKKD